MLLICLSLPDALMLSQQAEALPLTHTTGPTAGRGTSEQCSMGATGESSDPSRQLNNGVSKAKVTKGLTVRGTAKTKSSLCSDGAFTKPAVSKVPVPSPGRATGTRPKHSALTSTSATGISSVISFSLINCLYIKKGKICSMTRNLWIQIVYLIL